MQGNKAGYQIKSINIVTSSDVASVSGTAPNFSITMNKIGSFTANLVLNHATKSDATITGAQFQISRLPAESLTFNKISKAFASGGGFSTVEILGGVQGNKAGYQIKSISAVTPSDVASASGTAPNISLTMTKAGAFTATIVLAHADKADANVTGTFEITKNAAESLTFNKISKAFASGGRFSTAEILGGVQGNKTGYQIKSISAVTPSDVASASGTAPNIALTMSKAGSFTANLVLNHATKSDATITGAQFEIINIIWEKEFGGSGAFAGAEDMIQAKDGNYVVVGFKNVSSARQPWIIKLNENGGIVWQRVITTSSNSYT